MWKALGVRLGQWWQLPVAWPATISTPREQTSAALALLPLSAGLRPPAVKWGLGFTAERLRKWPAGASHVQG